MQAALVKYGACVSLAILLCLALPVDAGAAPQASRKATAQVKKTKKVKKPPPRKARTSRSRRAPRSHTPSVPARDTSLTKNFTAAQGALREQIDRWLDVRYKRGGTTVNGVDCSGFLLRIYRDALALDLPRSSREQATVGGRVDRREMAFGDLVFFRTRWKSKRISHVGVYVGDGRFVHASRQRGVTVDELSSSYYRKRFVMARRVLPGEAGALTE